MIRCVCQVYGCADLTEVPNAALRRHGNTVVVKCHYNGQTYLLTCVNNRWNGDLANCSKGMHFFYDTLNLAVWRSGSTSASINEVTLLQLVQVNNNNNNNNNPDM